MAQPEDLSLMAGALLEAETAGRSRVADATTWIYDADDRVTSVTTGYGSSAASTSTTTYDIAPASCPSAPTGTTYCTQDNDGLGNTTTRISRSDPSGFHQA